MPFLTGVFVLNHEKSSSQQDLLTCMGRRPWEIWAINSADELFRLIQLQTAPVKIEKHIEIKLRDPLAMLAQWARVQASNTMSSIVSFGKNLFSPASSQAYKVEVKDDDKPKQTSLVYNDTFCTDMRVESHANDEKGFGDCTTQTKLTPEGFDIYWHLPSGELTVKHCLKRDGLELLATLTFTNKQGQTATALKHYDRIPWGEADLQVIQKHPQKARIAGCPRV